MISHLGLLGHEKLWSFSSLPEVDVMVTYLCTGVNGLAVSRFSLCVET